MTFSFAFQNTTKIKFRREIWIFSFQICFQNKFWNLGSGQTENMPSTPIGVIGVF